MRSSACASQKDPSALQRAKEWLNGPIDEKSKSEIRRWIQSDPKELSDAFFKDLSFGTGGMRGVMGVGTSRMNLYTVRFATQGLASYLLEQPEPEGKRTVFIGYDTRENSLLFAQQAAQVLAGNGISVLLSEQICPTPLVSFACREYGCCAAIMITASHNPPQYNGYKVYWSDGGQVVPPHDTGIMEQVRKSCDFAKVQIAPLSSPLITQVANELDRAYLSAIKPLQLYPELTPSSLRILYTPLHGTGLHIVPEALKNWGYDRISLVAAQSTPDPRFPFAPSPNPEEEKALALGTEQLLSEKGDLLIATDPDTDRMGIVALDQGKPYRLTGNQTACIALYHICTALSLQNELPSNAAFIKTIVTTELFRTIAEAFGAKCIDVLTGFKYIAQKMTLWEMSFDAEQFIFGAEESYGYLYGTHARDKDAIISSCLIAEAAALAKKENLTLVDRLYQIYQRFGVHREALSSIAFEESAAGMEQMKALMQRLRKNPPKTIADIPVRAIEDYQSGRGQNLATGAAYPLDLPTSDVLRFWLQDKTKLVIRPSGTEPKVKIYAEVVDLSPREIDDSIRQCDEKLRLLIKNLSQWASKEEKYSLD